MIRNIAASLLFFIYTTSLSAQTIRTDVTVIGSSAAGISAGIQAARSGVKTLVLGPSNNLNFSSGDLITLERIRDHYRYKTEIDSSTKNSSISPRILPENASQVLKAISDTVKNLTKMPNGEIRGIEKKRKGWEIKLSTGQTIKTDIIVDAGTNPKTLTMLKADPLKTIVGLENWLSSPASMPRLFRTSFGWGSREAGTNKSIFLIPAATLMPVGIENLFLIPDSKNDNDAGTMLAGQAAGASAAFCAFFKTTSKNLNIRVTQGELLAYDARLIPYSDVNFDDRHAIAFQHIGLTGILKAKFSDNNQQQMVFDTLGTVSSEELRLPMKEYYSRSQLWFADHKKDSLSVKDAIDLLMFTATRGEELRKEIEAGWQGTFKFQGKYQPEKPINRREFAVLTDRYLQPFNIRVDFTGRLLN